MRSTVSGLRLIVAAIALSFTGLLALDAHADYRAIIASERLYSDSRIGPVALDDAGGMIFEEYSPDYSAPANAYVMEPTGSVKRLDHRLGLPGMSDPLESGGVRWLDATAGGLITYQRRTAPGGTYLFDPTTSTHVRLDTLGVRGVNDARLGLMDGADATTLVELPVGSTTPIVRATLPSFANASSVSFDSVDRAGRVAGSRRLTSPSGQIQRFIFHADWSGANAGMITDIAPRFQERHYEHWIESTDAGHVALIQWQGILTRFHRVVHVRPDNTWVDLNSLLNDPSVPNLELIDLSEAGAMILRASAGDGSDRRTLIYQPDGTFTRWRFDPIDLGEQGRLLTFTPNQINSAGQLAGHGLMQTPTGQVMNVVGVLTFIPEPATMCVIVSSGAMLLRRQR